MTGKDTHTPMFNCASSPCTPCGYFWYSWQLRLLSRVNKLTADRLIKCRIQLGPDQLRMKWKGAGGLGKGDSGWRIVVLEWATLCPCLLWPRAKVNTSNSMPQMKHSLFPLTRSTACLCVPRLHQNRANFSSFKF